MSHKIKGVKPNSLGAFFGSDEEYRIWLIGQLASNSRIYTNNSNDGSFIDALIRLADKIILRLEE